MKKDNSKKIKALISNVFTGAYGEDRGTLPHETINFFRADNDNCYGFIPNHGLFNDDFWSKLKSKDKEAFQVLYVSSNKVSKGLLQVYGYSKGIKYSFAEGIVDLGSIGVSQIIKGLNCDIKTSKMLNDGLISLIKDYAIKSIDKEIKSITNHVDIVDKEKINSIVSKFKGSITNKIDLIVKDNESIIKGINLTKLNDAIKKAGRIKTANDIKKIDSIDLKKVVNLIDTIYSRICNIILQQTISYIEILNSDYNDKRESIVYNGIKLKDIYKDDELSNGMYATFQFDNSSIPSKPVYLTNEKKIFKRKNNSIKIGNCEYLEDNSIIYVPINNKINNQSMRLYIDDNNIEAFNNIIRLIEDRIGWKKVEKLDKSDFEDRTDFFDITMQKDNEVMYTNSLYYFFFKNNLLLKRFIKNVLRVDADEYEAEIAREESKMDLSIKINSIKDESKNKFVIIENKIKSDINGIKEKGKNGVNSQLKKYYEIAKEKYDEKNIHCYLLSPNYHKFVVDGFEKGDKYKDLKYSKIYNFFTNVDKKVLNQFSNDDLYHFNDFIKSIKRHSGAYNDDFRRECLQRLKNRIMHRLC